MNTGLFKFDFFFTSHADEILFFGQYMALKMFDIRGRGLFLGIEFVSNTQTKEPFVPDRSCHRYFKAAAFEQGLICYLMGGTVDGRRGDHVLIAPPFIITDDQIDELGVKLQAAVSQVLA